ncbi:MAG: nucleotidyltransferase family protein [Syntrophaceae bacterium]|nr:nucleotidyltransferase family protein [Syntrophaceae bacterium]
MTEQTASVVIPKKIAALVLAAGLSSRMSEFKPLLKFGAKTVLERVVEAFWHAGVEDVRVVVGHREHDLTPVLERRHIRWIKNERYQEGMLSSIKAGVASIEQDIDGFFVTPVDIPLVRTSTIAAIVDAFRESGKLICYPNFLGRRGHPPLISTQYRDEILQWDKPGGLKGFLQQKEVEAIDLTVQDERILLDMDTLEDYQRLLEIYKNAEIFPVQD